MSPPAWKIGSSPPIFLLSLLCRLSSFAGLELSNFKLHLLFDSGLKLLPIAKLEEELEPDKKRRKEDCLNEVVQKCWSTTLEGTVAHELEKPTDYMQSNSILVHSCGVLDAQRVAEGCGGEADYGEDGASYRLQKNVEPTPDKGC